MSRSQRQWAWGLLGVGAAVALVVALLVVVSGDDGPEVEIDEKGPGDARVSWGKPEGDPKGLVMLLHGGGWEPNPGGYEASKQNAEILQGQGYATVAVGYGVGATGFRQIQGVYDEARKRFPDLPICISGISSGGHLGLLLATREPDIACVVDVVGPINLATLGEQDEEKDEAYGAAIKAFGEDNLAKYSPVNYADRIEARVLMILAETDPINPVEQGEELERALPDAELLVLPPGPVESQLFHFGGVQADAQQVAAQRIGTFISEAMQPS